MIKVCEPNTFCGIRDKALLFFLLDTGERAGEMLAINIEDINQARGDILIRHSKGKRPVSVSIPNLSLNSISKYELMRIIHFESPILDMTCFG